MCTISKHWIARLFLFYQDLRKLRKEAIYSKIYNYLDSTGALNDCSDIFGFYYISPNRSVIIQRQYGVLCIERLFRYFRILLYFTQQVGYCSYLTP